MGRGRGGQHGRRDSKRRLSDDVPAAHMTTRLGVKKPIVPVEGVVSDNHHHQQQQQQQDGSKILARQASRVLKTWAELPDWQKHDNNFISTGYRPTSGSYLESLRSWGYLHNETVNIFSHLFGCLLFLSLPSILYCKLHARYPSATNMDILVFGTYLFGVAVCFAFSVVYHTFANHSARVADMGIQLDFQGILLLIWGATIPTIYYGLYCSPHLQRIYWILITTLLILTSILTFHPTFRSSTLPFARPIRATVFGSFALSTLIPVLHGIWLYGPQDQQQRVGLRYLLGDLAFNVAGAVAYASKFPEKFSPPKTFDILGGSHQIMHVMVLCAAVVHVFGLIADFDFLHSHVPLPAAGGHSQLYQGEQELFKTSMMAMIMGGNGLGNDRFGGCPVR